MSEPFTPSFFRRLQQLQIRTRRSFLGSRQGAHRSLRKGHGLEFSDYRPYTPGDDFRHIDWGVYGRTDRVYVRQFSEEQDLNVAVLLDTSASMNHPEGEGKYELAKNLGLALGYVALTNGDSVTYSALGKRSLAKLSGPKAAGRAQKEMNKIEAGGSFDMLTEVRAAIARHRMPGKCFFVSDFLFSLESQFSTLDFLRSRNFEIVLIQVLAPSELSLNLKSGDIVVDAETGQKIEISIDTKVKQDYALNLATHIESLEKYCLRAGIDHILVSSKDSVSDVVLSRLPGEGILR